MTTNDKEYMKQYQRERRAKIKAAKIVKNNVKIVKKSVKNLENLHLPIEVGEKLFIGDVSLKSIDGHKKGNSLADSKPYKSRWDPTDMSVLRAFCKIFTGFNIREDKIGTIKHIIVALKKELTKLELGK